MTAFYDIPFFPRSLFGLWAFLLCCIGIAGIILSFALKRYAYALISLLSLAPAFFLWQAVFNLYRFGKGGLAAPVCLRLGALPWLLWLLMFLPPTALAALAFYLNVRRSRSFITPLAIKLCADRMSCGVCYWLDSGRVVFANACMNRLCLALTGEPFRNGNDFCSRIPDGVWQNGPEAWRFTVRELEFEGRKYREMIAWDVSEIHRKTEALRKDNEEMARLNRELEAYSLRIDDTVRRQEILQAKVNIHDEMNRLMLSLATADPEDGENLDRLFTQWNRNTLLLCMEAEEKKAENALEQLDRTAQLLGLQLIWRGVLPEALKDGQRELFFAAAREAAVNAVKHAGAKSLEISFRETEREILCCFVNEGRVPDGKVHFLGGLANLALLAEEQGAGLSAEGGENFRLQLRFGKNCE